MEFGSAVKAWELGVQWSLGVRWRLGSWDGSRELSGMMSERGAKEERRGCELTASWSTRN